MKRKIILALYILASWGLIQACETESTSTISGSTEQMESVEDLFFVSKDMAILVAKDFAYKYELKFLNLFNQKEFNNKENIKNVEHILPLKNSNNEVALYLVNLEDEGFVIISADKRVNPILAYSDTKKMPTDPDEPLPGGLNIWLKTNIAIIDSIRATNGKITESIHEGWKAFLLSGKSKSMPDPDPDPPCENELYEKGPLLQTQWGQGDGYNNTLTHMNCTTTFNGNPPAGCVATAVAQVMRYHEHPANYNWSSMPDGPIYYFNQPSGTNEIAQLMKDIGDAVDMDWACNGSGAYTSDAEDALEDDFNYSSSVSYQSYDRWDVRDEIKSLNRPVILRGVDSGFGHAWVAEGYRLHYIYTSSCIANGYLSFYMNWGWNGDYNGWYNAENFTPSSHDFDSGLHQLIGIKP